MRFYFLSPQGFQYAAAVQNGGDVCSTLASDYETIPPLDASSFLAAAAPNH